MTSIYKPLMFFYFVVCIPKVWGSNTIESRPRYINFFGKYSIFSWRLHNISCIVCHITGISNDVNSISYQDCHHRNVDKYDSPMGIGHQRDYWVIFNQFCHKALSDDGHSILFKRRTTPFESSESSRKNSKNSDENF